MTKVTQESFVTYFNECSTLSKIIYKYMKDKNPRSSDLYEEFVETSSY